MNKVRPRITPKMTLTDIYGADYILNPRPSFTGSGWLPPYPDVLDFLTGSPLLISGLMPVICSHHVCADNAAALLAKANLEITPGHHIFHTQSEYLTILKSLSKQKKKLIVNHLHPPDEIRQKDYWISKKILAYLNNKAHLKQIVPKSYVPKRKVAPASEITKAIRNSDIPVVIKASTSQPTGGGYGVFICKNARDINQAYQKLRNCNSVVIEEYVEIKSNYCVQFAVTNTGQIVYLGASQQLIDPPGFYYGNLLSRRQTPPDIITDLGRAIIEYARNLGYIGIAGFDIVITKDDRVLVIDLNFRLNGSTPALLFQDSIYENYRISFLLYRSWHIRCKWDRFLSICNDSIEKSWLIPYSLYDSSSNPQLPDTYHFSGMLTGISAEDVWQKHSTLSKLFS